MNVECARDRSPMIQVYSCKVRGIDTIHHRCPTCGGKADIQIKDGMARQVRLTGAPEEFKPESIRPNQQVRIEGLGGGYVLPVPQRRIDPNQLRAQIMGTGR